MVARPVEVDVDSRVDWVDLVGIELGPGFQVVLVLLNLRFSPPRAEADKEVHDMPNETLEEADENHCSQDAIGYQRCILQTQRTRISTQQNKKHK